MGATKNEDFDEYRRHSERAESDNVNVKGQLRVVSVLISADPSVYHQFG